MAWWPWADVLAAELMLDELERVEGLQRRQEALEQAQLIALAYHEPGKLAAVARDLAAEAEDRPTRSPAEAASAAAQVTDLMEFAERIERRKRRGN